MPVVITDNSGNPIDSLNPLAVSTIGGLSIQPIFNAYSITDTVAHTGTGINVTGFQKIAIRVQNTLNQSLTLYILRGDTATDATWATDKSGNNLSYSIPASMTKELYITQTDVAMLGFVQFANVQVVAATAPSSGSLTVEVVGRN